MTVRQTLDAHRGSLTLHDRMLAMNDVLVRLDHVLSSQGGAFLIQERDDPSDAELDTVRRTAEALELVVVRPIEPIVVTDSASTPTSRRGVKLLNSNDFGRWVDALTRDGDKGQMVITNARVTKVTEDWTAQRRIPEWEIQARLRSDGVYALAPAEERIPRSGLGPRSWSLGTPSAPAPRSRPWRSRRRAAQAVALVLAVGMVLLLIW